MKKIFAYLLLLLPFYLNANAVDDSYQTTIDKELIANVLDNDTGYLKVVSWNTSPSHGRISGIGFVYKDGAFSYTPDKGFSGTDSFTYTMVYFLDGQWHSDTATVTINVVDSNIVENADDLCYKDPVSSGFFCIDIGICSGGIGCKNTYTLKNIGDSDLSDTKVIYDETNLGGSFYGKCGVNPSGSSCTKIENINMGPFGFLGSATQFNLENDIPPEDDSNSIWTKNFARGSCFNGERMYATYMKDGKLHRGKVKPCSALSSDDGHYRDFILRKKLIARGNMITIGNTILVVPKKSPGTDCKNYTNQSYYSTTNNANDSYHLCPYYADGIHPSTSAKAKEGNRPNEILPDSKLLWAGLYWQSIVKNSDKSNIINQTIQIKNGSSNYVSLTPDVLDYKKNAGEDGYTSYSAFADITKILKEKHWLTGTYTVANIPTEKNNIESLGQYGAWTLVLVYGNPNEKMRDFSIFDGWKKVSGDNAQTANVKIDISGFYTPKKTPINSTVSVFTAEGDRFIGGDYLKAQNANDNNDFTNLTYTTGQTFDSSIYPTTMVRNPDPDNNQGIDIQSFPIGTNGKNLLKPKQTEISFKFTTKTSGNARDTYFPSLITFNTEVYIPDLCYDYTYGQDGFYKIAPHTDQPYINDHFDVSKALNVKLYIENKEDSDVILANTFIHIKDINTTQAVYKRESTEITTTHNTLQPVPDDGREVSDSHDMNISVGFVEGYQHFYTYYSLDLKQENIDMPINAYIQYDLSIQGIPLGKQELAFKDLSICQDSGNYQPIYGAFNVVHPHEEKNTDPYYYYNLPTQIVGRTNPFLLESMKGDNYNFSDTATETTVKAAAVELIDADGFHFVQATCTDPKAKSFSTQKIWTAIHENEYAHNINQAALLNNGFFKYAMSNAAFRIIYNTLPDGTIVHFTKVSTDHYKLSNLDDDEKILCSQECGAYIQKSGGDIDNNITFSTCMDCLYQISASKLCSRDNFSIRPEAYAITLHDKNATDTSTIAVNTPAPNLINLASGYPYNIEVNATDHFNSATPTPRYHANDINATIAWVSGSYDNSCNDTEDNVSSITFSDGYNLSERQLDQVGKYKFHLLDSIWTTVDHVSTYMQHHVTPYFRSGNDCIENEDLVRIESSIEQNGCDVSSNHHNIETKDNNKYKMTYTDMYLRFYPYTFDHTGLKNLIGPKTRTGGQTFVYINTPPTMNIDDKDMSYNMNGVFYASGKNGAQLSNFVNGCYADDVNMTLSFSYNSPATAQTPYLSYSLREVDATDTAIRPASGFDLETGTSSSNAQPFTIPQAKTYFAKDMNGSVKMNLGYNFKRDYNVPLNPRYILFKDFNLTYQTNPTGIYAEMSNNYQIMDNKKLDQNVTFIYGRAKSSKELYNDITTTSVRTPISIVAYCDQDPINCSALYNINSLEYNRTNEYDWYLVKGHAMNDGDGNIQLRVSTTNTSVSNSALSVTSPVNINNSGGIDTNVWVSTTNTTVRPLLVNIDFMTGIGQTDTWVIYNKDKNTTPSPFYQTNFIGVSDWAGHGDTGNVVDSNASTHKNRRLGW